MYLLLTLAEKNFKVSIEIAEEDMYIKLAKKYCP